MRRPATYRPFAPLPVLPAPVFPCLTPGSNSYHGCIGVGKCQSEGTERCLLGRWATAPYRALTLAELLPTSPNGGARP